MLHVILFVLKIIGLILLAVLGLLLVLALTVLFVPIRYRAFAQKEEENISLDAKVHWLLHLITLRITWINGELISLLKVAGITVYDNRKPKAEKKRREKKAEKSKRTKSEKKMQRLKDYKKLTAEENKDEETPPVGANTAKTDRIEIDFIDEGKNRKNEIEQSVIKKEEIIVKNEEVIVKNDTIMQEKTNLQEEKCQQEEKQSFFSRFGEKTKLLIQKIRKIIQKIKDSSKKAVSFVRKIREKMSGFVNIIKNIKIKKELIQAFLKEPVNRNGIKSAFRSVVKLLKHIRPKKLHGRIQFGTGDPCSTGQALGIAGVFYGMYGDKIIIQPDFENEVLNGELYVRGRIRLIVLLIITVKLLLNEEFKQLLKNAQRLKEEF